jgi:hypothetical protein
VNCRRARQLISSYIDYQLTGQQMLEIQQHLHDCPECVREYYTLRQVKVLVRALHEQTPCPTLSTRITAHLDQELISPRRDFAFNWQRPQRGRRLATALALSCIGILIAAAPFAPSTTDMSAPSTVTPPRSAFLITASQIEGRTAPLQPPDFALTTVFSSPASYRQPYIDRNQRILFAQPSLQGVETGPWNDEAVRGYIQGDATLADFQTRR